MKEMLLEKFKMIFIFMFFYLLMEAATFAWVDFSFLPKSILIDIVIAFAVGSFVFWIKSIRGSIIYLGVIFFLIVVLFLLNTTIYSVYYDLFTLQQLMLVNEATNVISLEMISLGSIIVTLVACSMFAVSMFFLHKHLVKTRVEIKGYYGKASLSFLVSALFIFGFFMLGTENINDFIEDSNVTTFKRSAFQTYGIFGYYTKEIEDIITQNEASSPGDGSVVYSEPTDYYGLLEGMNVITIMMESVQPFAINEVLTPNLYMLTQEGLYFENSYCENKTNVSEMIGITGNYPTIYFNTNEYTYDFSYSLPSVLAEDDYSTSYYHDNVASFYKRGTLMPQLGFDNVYLHEELYPGEDIWRWTGDYTLDTLTMGKMLENDFTTTDRPFYSFWATLSTHGPYNYGPENKELFEILGYFAAIDQAELDGTWTNILAGGEETDVLRIRHYQAAVMNLDAAIGMMLDDLEDKGILEDTIIVMFGDHNVYYHEIYLKRFPEFNDYYNMEMYHNFFCIYNPVLTETYLERSGAENTTISKFVSPYNIYPTLMDLLGYQYNVNLTMADSIFADTEEVFYSIKITGFFNYNLFSDDGIEIVYYKEEYTNGELIRFVSRSNLMKERIDYINKYYTETRRSIE